MISKAQSGHAENRATESHPSDASTELEDRAVDQEILQVLYENLVRCGGACQVSVRTVSRVVSKRVKGLKNRGFLKRLVRDVLENLSWASFWDYGYQTTGANNRNLAGRVYALKMGPVELAQVKEQLIQRGPVRTPGSRDFRDLRKRMLRTLSEEFPLSPKELAERFEEAYDRIGSQLHHMVKRGELVRPKSGFYCLPGQLNEARKRIEEKQNPLNPHSILEILSEAFPQSTEQIARRLNTRYSLVRSILNRLAKKGELARIRTGFYCLPNQVAEVKRKLRAEGKTYSEVLGVFADDSVLAPREVARKLGKNPFAVQSAMRRLVESGNLVKIRHGFYCLTPQVKSGELQSTQNRSLEKAIVSHSGSKNDQTRSKTGNSTIAKAIVQVLQLLLYSPRMTLMQIVVTTGMTESTISKATERLMDLSILIGDESGQVSIAPQEDPETIRIIQMVGEKGLDETIRALAVEYLQRKLDKTQKRVFNMRQLKKYVRERLQLLTVLEFRREMAQVLESFTSNGAIESLDGDVHRFSPSVAEASA